MGSHYIPQYYLEGFCESSTPRIITRYEKGSPNKLTTQISSVAQESGFYSDAVEKFLAEEIEGPANPVLNKIRQRNSISITDKYVLSAYMITMLKRVPESQARFKESAPQIIESVFSNLDNELLKKRSEEVEQAKAQLEANLQKIWYQQIAPHSALVALAALNVMTWQFFTSDKDSAFLTSDNPVFFHEELGIGHQHSEVSFPISRNVVLWATWRTDLPEGFVQSNERMVREINRRTVSTATRYVFYSREEEWVVNLVNKRKLKVHRMA